MLFMFVCFSTDFPFIITEERVLLCPPHSTWNCGPLDPAFRLLPFYIFILFLFLEESVRVARCHKILMAINKKRAALKTVYGLRERKREGVWQRSFPACYTVELNKLYVNYSKSMKEISNKYYFIFYIIKENKSITILVLKKKPYFALLCPLCLSCLINTFMPP